MPSFILLNFPLDTLLAVLHLFCHSALPVFYISKYFLSLGCLRECFICICICEIQNSPNVSDFYFYSLWTELLTILTMVVWLHGRKVELHKYLNIHFYFNCKCMWSFRAKKKKLDSFFYEGKWKHPWQNIIMPSVETYKKDSISWQGRVPEGIPSCHSIEKILRNDGFSTSWFLYLVQN